MINRNTFSKHCLSSKKDESFEEEGEASHILIAQEMKGGIETIKLSKLAKEKSEKLWCKIWIICIGK